MTRVESVDGMKRLASGWTWWDMLPHKSTRGHRRGGERLGRIVQGLKDQRFSILLVEQNYHLALQVADRVYVMNKGQIVYEGTPASLRADEDVKRRYLGVA